MSAIALGSAVAISRDLLAIAMAVIDTVQQSIVDKRDNVDLSTIQADDDIKRALLMVAIQARNDQESRELATRRQHGSVAQPRVPGDGSNT